MVISTYKVLILFLIIYNQYPAKTEWQLSDIVICNCQNYYDSFSNELNFVNKSNLDKSGSNSEPLLSIIL